MPGPSRSRVETQAAKIKNLEGKIVHLKADLLKMAGELNALKGAHDQALIQLAEFRNAQSAAARNVPRIDSLHA
jgi:hypothetical protein